MAYRRKFWRNMTRSALTYEEWAHAAKMLDKETLRISDSDLYDEELVRNKLQELHHRHEEGCLRDIILCMRADLVRNLGNMCNPELHRGRLQVQRLIKDYIDKVSIRLRMVCGSDSEELSVTFVSDVVILHVPLTYREFECSLFCRIANHSFSNKALVKHVGHAGFA